MNYENLDMVFAKVIALIAKKRDGEALVLFEKEAQPMYREHADNPDFRRIFVALYVSVDEFLMNDAARSLVVASRENVLAEYSVYAINERLEIFLPPVV